MKIQSALVEHTHGNFLSGFRVSNLMIKIGVVSLFVFSVRVINSPVIFLSHLLMLLIIFLAIWNKRFLVDRTIFVLLCFFCIHGMVSVLLANTTLFLFLENYLRLSMYYLAFSCILLGNPRKNIMIAVQLYLKLAIWASVIGLIALAAYVVNFRPGYDYSWFLNAWDHIAWGGHLGLPRAQSIFGEPAHAVYVLGPAIYFGIGRLLGAHKELLSFRAALAISAFIFMTNSTTAYVTVPVAFLLNLRNSLKQFLYISMALGLVAAIYVSSTDFNFDQNFRKLELVVDLIEADGQVTGVTGSSYSAYVGNIIAFEIFNGTLGFGGGLGSFEANIDEIYGSLNVTDGNFANTQTGGSLMARSIAELGIFGIGLWFMAAIMTIRGVIVLDEPYRSINLAMFVGFLPFFLRMGTYDIFGLSFFVTVFILNSKMAAARSTTARMPSNG